MVLGPIELVQQIAALFDELAIPYALGGSVASSLFGEPRSTVDVDVAIDLAVESEDRLLESLQGEFYVPLDSARLAIRTRSSFNVLGAEAAAKVDVFVLGDGLLDRMQIERRVWVPLFGEGSGVWVTSPEDQVLRKLDWFRLGGRVSDRQWRDVVGLLTIQANSLDFEYMRSCASELGLTELLDAANAGGV